MTASSASTSGAGAGLCRATLGSDFTSMFSRTAAAAGWAPGDVILTVDGAEVDSSRAVVAALQKGGPVKPVVLDRGGQRLTTTLDYSGDEAERERLARRSQREAAGLIEASTVSE